MSWELNKIPKICHVYWGGSRLPYARFLTIQTFKRFNPEWIVKLYIPERLYQGNNDSRLTAGEHNQQVSNVRSYMQEVKQYCTIEKVSMAKIGFNDNITETFKSDLYRLCLLSTIGGLWCDSDIIFYKSMDELYFNKDKYKDKDTFVCIDAKNRYVYHSIGFMMASENNKFFKIAYQKAKEEYDNKEFQSMGSALLNSMGLDDKIISDKFGVNAFNISMDVVYKLSSFDLPKIFDYDFSNNLIREPASIGLHWYAGALKAQQHINSLSIDNYKHYPEKNTLSQIIKYALRSD